MASRKTLLYYGALLRDIGKIVCRANESDEPISVAGSEFILRTVASLNEGFAGDDGLAIAEQILYRDRRSLAAATDLPDDSLAYVTSFAGEVVAGLDDDREGALGRTAKLRKIFNRLNGHADDNVIEHEGFDAILERVLDGLSRLPVIGEGVGQLLNLLESATSDIPASTDAEGLVDVSLYDCAKVTAGVAACVHEYLLDLGVSDYREALLGSGLAKGPGAEEMFLLYSCDMSGIQDFIYNISGDGALKQLRARSMYLELLLEHIVDELLDRLGLARTNLLYTGGGHAYLLLPNTMGTVAALRRFDRELTQWFVRHYRNDLYVASAWVACSADDLANRGVDKGRYPMLYRRLSRGLSEAKSSRYDAETIGRLNFGPGGDIDHSRECSECHRSDLHLDKDGKCTLCAALGLISKSLVDKVAFVVERSGDALDTSAWPPSLALPFGCRLRVCTHEEERALQASARRTYAKGTAVGSETRIWMGDYTADTAGEGLSAYASRGSTLEQGLGINRLGVLRADVDDLGATFVSGLPDERVSLARTTELSRSLSRFFKSEINDILRKGDYQLQVIYSGGDDLFVVGNWSDVLRASVAIRRALDEYTGNGSLTLSAGVGMFGDTYPIARMAAETGALEDAAKGHVDEATREAKNAIALWSADSVFGWGEFVETVMPRMAEVHRMFGEGQKGNAFTYRLIDLLRTYDSVASAPRLAYLLARSFEGDHPGGKEACRQIYSWAQDPRERRRLITALEWHVYSTRKGSDQ